MERPILFSGPMVRALLEGRKTQTRRIAKFQGFTEFSTYAPGIIWHGVSPSMKLKCPYGRPGDCLWVRETWGAVWPDMEWTPLEQCKIEYRADLPPGSTDFPGQWPAEDGRGSDEAPKWRPSIHMPRWASRIILVVNNVRLERLQMISHADILAEGIRDAGPGGEIINTDTFARLWDEINGDRAPWVSNPWVWVMEFRRSQP
jgi:hypothetical protein